MLGSEKHTNQNLASLDAFLTEDPQLFAVSQIEDNLRKSGSTWMKVPRGPTMQGLWYANLDGEVYVTSPRYGEAETYLANWIRKHNVPERAVPLSGYGLTESQSRAAKLCLEHKVACLSGLPGTGKTYTCEAIAESFTRDKMVVKGCALTGIAASNLEEKAQVQSTTIHRLLGWKGPREGYTVDEVEADVILVDEASMDDNAISLSLVSRLPKDCRLILVGDPDQLPSIEPSDTFRELCKALPHARLLDVLRTEKDSPLGYAAKSVLAGNVPPSEDFGKDGGFYNIPCDGLGIDSMGRREKNHPLTVAERMADSDQTELRFVRTMASSNEAVTFINDKFSAYKKVASRTPYMCTLNRHDFGIYNGDIGYLVLNRKYNSDIDFGEVYTLPHSQCRKSWCTTVHKAQGQECLSAQLWIESCLTVRAAYTALTRAKRRFCFTGNMDTLQSCLHAVEDPRITLLSALISGRARYTDTTG